MPDLSKITLPSGSTYDLKDAIARQMISQLNQFTYEVVSELPTASASTMYKIYLVAASTPGTQDIYEEYITIDKGASASPRYIWEKFGTITPPDLTDYAKWSDLGALATKDSASGTVAGIPKTFTTTTTVATSSSKSVSVSGTTAGSVSVTKGAVEIKPSSTGTAANKYTPAGSVSVSTAGSTTTIKNPTSKNVVTDMSVANPSATAATGELIYYSVSDETLSLKKLVETTGDSITTSNVTVKNGDAAYSFAGTDAYFKTASDVATDASFSGASMTSTGSVSVPATFSSSTTVATTEGKSVTVS